MKRLFSFVFLCCFLVPCAAGDRWVCHVEKDVIGSKFDGSDEWSFRQTAKDDAISPFVIEKMPSSFERGIGKSYNFKVSEQNQPTKWLGACDHNYVKDMVSGEYTPFGDDLACDISSVSGTFSKKSQKFLLTNTTGFRFDKNHFDSESSISWTHFFRVVVGSCD